MASKNINQTIIDECEKARTKGIIILPIIIAFGLFVLFPVFECLFGYLAILIVPPMIAGLIYLFSLYLPRRNIYKLLDENK